MASRAPHRDVRGGGGNRGNHRPGAPAPSAANCKDCMVYAGRGGKCHRHGGAAGNKSKASPAGRGDGVPTLENWEVLNDGRVKGAVYGRQGFPDGQEITTGAVVTRTSTEVKTNSGSRYRLGKKKPVGASSADKKKPLQPSGQGNKQPGGGRRIVGGGKQQPGSSNMDGKHADSDDDGDDGFDELENLPAVGRGGDSNGSAASVLSAGSAASNNSNKKLLGNNNKHGATLHEFKQDIYVGDRVRVKSRGSGSGSVARGGGGGGAEGVVMFTGPCEFAGGRVMVGLRMDDRQPGGAGHDGKEQGERHFRCESGHGSYVVMGDVTLVARGRGQQNSGSNNKRGGGGGRGGAANGEDDDDEGPFDLEAELERLVGIDAVKRHILSLRNRLEVGRRRAAFGVTDNKPLHTVMVGSKGMDFHGVAAVLGGMLKSLQVTARAKLVEVSRKDLVGGNTEKTTEMVAAALKKVSGGGVMFLADAAALGSDKSDHYGQLALQQVVAHFEELAASQAAAAEKAARAKKNGSASAAKAAEAAANGPRSVLLVNATRAELATLFTSAPGLQGIVGTTLEFQDYTIDEMASLLRRSTEDKGFYLHKELTEEKLVGLLRAPLARVAAGKGGKILVERLVEEAIHRQTDRVHMSGTRSKDSLLSLTEADFTEVDAGASGDTIEAVLRRLDGIIGLAGVKKHVRSLVAQLQLVQKKKLAGLPAAKSGATMHMVFSGNPGTGKTTVARIVAELLQALGYLKRGHLVETDRAGLVAPYVGQTAIKVQGVVESAMGGMLFVDEAYALVKDAKDSFGREALDTLIKMVEDHRDELVVVLAGYPSEMNELMAHNPGVRSRFPTVIHFEDYCVAELMQIAGAFIGKQHLNMTPEAEATLGKKLTAMVEAASAAGAESRENGNGRAVRNFVEQAMRAQALRLADSDKTTMRPTELARLEAEDFI